MPWTVSRSSFALMFVWSRIEVLRRNHNLYSYKGIVLV